MQNFSFEQIDRIRNILNKTTVVCRKGNTIQQRTVGEIRPGVPAMILKEIFDMPSPEQLQADNIEQIDMHFVIVAVQVDAIDDYREEIDELLLKWPQPDRLAAGPSYLELGGILHDQTLALQFMALGQVMGYWEVETPASMGFSGDIADTMAGQGLVCITGWRPA